MDFTLRDGRVEEACQLPGNNVARTSGLSTSRDCPRICEFSRSRNPLAIPVIEHIEDALAAGYPSVLQYLGRDNIQQSEDNRQYACGESPNSFRRDLVKQWRSEGLSCDEYPFASTAEGGRGLLPAREPSIRAVPKNSNSSQGGILGGCYAGLQAGDYIRVVVVP